jgi:hypothetical protein
MEKKYHQLCIIRELEMKLDEENKLNKNYETRIIRLEKELRIVGLEAMRLEGDRIKADARCDTYRRKLSLILDKVEEREESDGQLNQSQPKATTLS